MAQIALLSVGDKAPHFDYRNPTGSVDNTAALRGSPFLVFFYPRDSTPGCTKEACTFRDTYLELREVGLTIIGVSADSEASHQRFREKHRLPYPMAADVEKTIIKAYGAWGEKKFMGHCYEGIHRVSYLVDSNGKITRVFPKVKPATHAAEVLEEVKKLQSV